MKTKFKFAILALGLSLFSCDDNSKKNGNIKNEKPSENVVPVISYSVISSSPHDTLAFTEGLLFHNNQLFESTGSPEDLPQVSSMVGIVNMANGQIDKKIELDRNIYFGEGIVLLKNKLYQLTYKNQIGFIYDAQTFKKIGYFNYQNKEGWGLTTDGQNIIMSDGTNTLTYLDPENLKPIKTLNITNNGYAEDYLNELEFINGFIYANIWTKNYIVKINPSDGKIVGILDLSNLMYKAKEKYPEALEMNGIAFNPSNNKIYVTGKLWPEIFQIDFPH